MKRVTADMLRAHLLVASLTAAGAEAVVCIALLVLPVSHQVFVTTPFRLLAIAVIVGGVIVTREFAQAAFELSVKSHHTMPVRHPASPIEVSSDCPRRWLVILHLRLAGRPFVLAGH